jgi:hypothetical protein
LAPTKVAAGCASDEAVPRRAVADDDHAQVGPVAPRRSKARSASSTFFSAATRPDREQHRRVGPRLPLRAQRGCCAPRA